MALLSRSVLIFIAAIVAIVLISTGTFTGAVTLLKFRSPPPALVEETTWKTCFDGKDNDGDWLVDCEEATCNGMVYPRKVDALEPYYPSCGAESADNPNSCFDHIDNDGDGKTDCRGDDSCFNKGPASPCQKEGFSYPWP